MNLGQDRRFSESGMSPWHPGRVAASLLALAVVIAIVIAIVVGGQRQMPGSQPGSAHPSFDVSLRCASKGCHSNTHRHEFPYFGECSKCHGLVSWRSVAYTHSDVDFNSGSALHGVIGCVRCHVEGGPLPSKACQSCHSSPHGGWNDCGKCHLSLGWVLRRPLPAGHLTLAGGHSGLSCFDCHSRATGHAKPRTCTSCHGTKHGGLTDCAECHDPVSGWEHTSFDHGAVFKIAGRHAGLACTRCHPNGRFANTSPACVSCHGPQHGGLRDCVRCHTVAGFIPSTFRHATVFPLSDGPHATLACKRCHPDSRFAEVRGRTCVTCHGPQHGGYTTCTPCHLANGAVKRPFDHTAFFPLAGGPHAALTCTQCHPSGDFAAQRGATCTTCHGLGHGRQTVCTPCHAANGAIQNPFDHAAFFPLAGGPHATLTCTQCHPGGDFPAQRGATCVTCHGLQHGGLTTCVPCHAANGAVDHTTFFELVGAHASLVCSACHGAPFHAASGTNCVDCHGIHHGNQTLCGDCHTTTAFVPTRPITHPAPIELGAQHSSRPCQLCHAGLVFNAPARPCSDCHTPPHVGPADCLSCHMPTVWTDTHFTHPDILPHSLQEFTCTQCHVGDDFTIPRAQICITCHW